jgi:hypothetical protein
MSLPASFNRLAATLLASTLLSSCVSDDAAKGVDTGALLPRLSGNAAVLNEISSVERAHLQLIATNLVATLVQIPEMRPATATLQINRPQSAFGNAIIRALEDAGFGMQVVSADQGQNFVSYRKRLSETESGLVTDYALAVGRIRLSREYVVQANAVYPSSLMNISGTDYIADIALADNIFAEQGGSDTAFISGAQRTGAPNPDLAVDTIDVNDFDELPQDKRTRQDYVFAEARQRFFEMDAMRQAPDLDQYVKHRRTVLIFDDNSTQMMGGANKRAVRLMVREFRDEDIMVIKACLDADGSDDASMNRAIRVEEELAGFGVPSESAYIAPCSRASYRHASDDSPTPVELVHYRPR